MNKVGTFYWLLSSFQESHLEDLRGRHSNFEGETSVWDVEVGRLSIGRGYLHFVRCVWPSSVS